MTIGDLTEQTRSQEKLTNNKKNSSRYNSCKNILDENALVNIGFTGLSYTWYCIRAPLAVVFARLD